MTSFVEVYLGNIQTIINNPPSSVVGVFAQNLYNDATDLVAEEITAEQFNDTGYLEIAESDSDDVLTAKRSLNHIKDRIFKDASGYYKTAKYDILNGVIMNRDELVKLYGANKKFYATLGIKSRDELGQAIQRQFALLYYQDSTVVVVDETLSVDNFVEIV